MQMGVRWVQEVVSLPVELIGVSMLSSDSEAASGFDRLRGHRPSLPRGWLPCKF